MSPFAFLTFLALLAGAPQYGQAPEKKAMPSADQALVQVQLPSYPLDVCVISGEKLSSKGDPVDLIHEGRLVRFCCKGCIKGFEKDPAASLAMIDAAVVAAQLDAYPMKTCPVSGEKLGGMGDPVDYVQGTRLVRFCCKGCVKGFQKEPGKYMAMVDSALIETQKKTYPLEVCVVSGEQMGGEMGPPVDMLYGTRLVRLCCKGCKKEFAKAPKEYLAKLDEASVEAMKMGKAKEAKAGG